MAKKTKPDEYFRRGPLEFARFGKGILIRSNWDEKDHKIFLDTVVKSAPKAKEKINRSVSEAVNLVRRNSPLRLLLAAHHLNALENSVTDQEPTQPTETAKSVETIHTLEFIQNVVASTPHELFKDDGDLDKDILEISRLVGEINRTITGDFLFAELVRDRGDDGADRDVAEFRHRAIGMWINVRGKRYTFHETKNLEDLLLGQDTAIQETFGVSAADLIAGFSKILESLTFGYGDAVIEFKKIDEMCAPELIGFVENSDSPPTSIEELQEIMHGIVAKRGFEERLSIIQEALSGYGLFDVGKITGLPSRCLSKLSWKMGEVDDFIDDRDFSAWPTRVTPISRRPFLEIDSKFYCFSAFGLCDNFYRFIARAARSGSKEALVAWNKNEKLITESLPLKYFGKLLPGSQRFQDIHYRWFPNANHKEREWVELDGLIICGTHLIIIEVKAVAFALKSPFDNFGAHIGSLESLVTEPTRQALRFFEYLSSSEEVVIYCSKHQAIQTIGKKDFSHITVCAISIDSFTEIASKIQHLGALGVEIADHHVLPISLDDLRVYSDVFTSPFVFLHFLEQRMKATGSQAVELDDELDHVGLYFEHNDYSLHAEDLKQGLDHISFSGYRTKIDNFFHGRLSNAELPSPFRQELPPKFREIIQYFEQLQDYGNLELSSFLLNLSAKARSDLNELIETALHRQPLRKTVIIASMTGEVRLTIACWQTHLFVPNRKHLLDHAKIDFLMHAEADRMVLELSFDSSSKLRDVNWEKISNTDIIREEREFLSDQVEPTKMRRVRQATVKDGKIGRNRNCPCGSGKKFKNCCWK